MPGSEDRLPVSTNHSEADDEDSSETESERNDTYRESVAHNAKGDIISTTSTELSEVPTLELLGISRPATPDFAPDASLPFGLHRPWGWSDYDDFE